ncbi:MAG: transposase, partial [Deltaproteobacteria bacterium]|nr:transposase [Deltaproteobacteria bacterium]
RDTSPEVEAWRRHMQSPEGAEAYRGRRPLVESVNGQLKARCGLTHFLVRGVEKATCVLLRTALAHNLAAHGQRLVDALA